MKFEDIRENEDIFLDANIFIYHFGKLSLDCKSLLLRCSRREINGYTSYPVIAETLHRLMIAEAVRKGCISSKNPVKRLKANPDFVMNLTGYNDDAASIARMNITILGINQRIMDTSAHIRTTEGLLTNDSLAAAVMKESGISNFATNDDDFDHIGWLNVYKPSDL